MKIDESLKTDIVIILNNILGEFSEENTDKYWEVSEEIVSKIDKSIDNCYNRQENNVSVVSVINFKEFLFRHKGKSAKEQAILFKKEFGKGYRTYHRLKRAMKKGVSYSDCCNEKTYRNIKNKNSECYFCEDRKDLDVHHINKNSKDDREENLLVLCNKCHNRLHRLLQKSHTISIIRGLKKYGKH
jgi:hypothetical protein